MTTSTAIPSSNVRYNPQNDRIGLLHWSVSMVMLAILLILLSAYIAQLDPKIAIMVATVSIFIGNKRLLAPHIWPLLAIIGYDAMLSFIFPGPRPEAGMILAHTLLLVDCIFLAALVLGGQSVNRQHMLMVGILIVSVIGAMGDRLGHDMTAMLPLPDDPFMDALFLQQSGPLRIRGFFGESGVLAAVSIGYASILVLGSVVLLSLGRCVRSAWIALLTGVCAGGLIFVITVTKSGIVMFAGSGLGFIAVLMCGRNPRYRAIAFASLMVLSVGCALFLIAGPPTLTEYLRGEIWAGFHPLDAAHATDGNYSGTLTRYKCWALALQSLRSYPLGVGSFGLGSVLQGPGGIGLTNEMRHFFSHDIFGLKNALANLLAHDGIVGILLLLYWVQVAFLRPIRQYLAEGSIASTLVAGMYGASALASFFFLFSCELYPSYTFVLVLKLYADAIAHACLGQPEPGFESVELIG